MAPSSLYRFASHGCVRMHPDDVAEAVDWTAVDRVLSLRRGGAVDVTRRE
jgi:lipoprotein-anchoring transpeptidase ErfK/SrfK